MKLLSQLLAILWITGSLIACSKDEVPEPNRTPLDPNGNSQFPDPIFATYMVEHFDTDGDGSISPAEAAAITEINCRGMGIESLAGIEYCTELTYLHCGYKYENGNFTYNKLTALDISKNTNLTYLHCGSNRLTALDVSNNTKLTELQCYNNQLTTLNVSKNTELTYLECSYNQLTTLNISKNTELTDLLCSRNQLTTLNVNNNTKLTWLNCSGNQLTVLDVSNTNLGNKYDYPLWCNMSSLKTLYLKTSWELKGINNPRDAGYIHPNTQIEYKD